MFFVWHPGFVKKLHFVTWECQLKKALNSAGGSIFLTAIGTFLAAALHADISLGVNTEKVNAHPSSLAIEIQSSGPASPSEPSRATNLTSRNQEISPESEDKLLKLPDGYAPGLADAKYGTYGSIFKTQEGVRLQRRLDFLENKILGFSKLSDQDPIKQSESIYLLEAALFRLHLDIGFTGSQFLTPFEREALLYGTNRQMSSLRFHGERIFEDMVRFIDVALPGPNGIQIRRDLEGSLEALYETNFRTSTPLTEVEKQKLYTDKLNEFLKKGGVLSEMFVLNADSVSKMGAFTRLEYVVRENGQIWATEGSAGHILLAEGKAVKSGGQIIILKDPAGKPTMIIISNSSGSYKPDVFSAQRTAADLAEMFKVEESVFVTTKGEPFSKQAVKIYSKGAKSSPTLLKQRMTFLEDVERRLRNFAFSKMAPVTTPGVKNLPELPKNSGALKCISLLAR